MRNKDYQVSYVSSCEVLFLWSVYDCQEKSDLQTRFNDVVQQLSLEYRSVL